MSMATLVDLSYQIFDVVDWNIPVLELLVSAILGFCSALVVEHIVAKNSEQKMQKSLAKHLLNELETAKESCEKLRKSSAYVCPYSIPIWKGACASGTITCLGEKDYFFELINAFSVIEEANLIEMKCFEASASNMTCTEVLIPVLLESRKKVRENVDAVIGKMKESLNER